MKLEAIEIDITGSLLEANKKVELKASDSIFADDAFLLACSDPGEVKAEAQNDIHLKSATARAFKEIEIKSKDGNVDLTEADLAIVTGSTKGDIKVEGDTIEITDASILAPDKIELKGGVSGTPAVIGEGTKDCP